MNIMNMTVPTQCLPVAMVSDTRTDQISVQNIVPVIYFADENETGIIYALDTKNS